jgi:hypothetical protein
MGNDYLYPITHYGYLLKAEQIRRDKKELRSFLSRCTVVVSINHAPHPNWLPG